MQEKNKKDLPAETIGARLHKVRKDKGLSQAEMAEQIGFKQSSTISKIESDRIDPDSNTLKKIAEALDTDLHWLITGESSPTTAAAIKTLKPFVYSYLSMITKKIQEAEEHCAKIRRQTAEAATQDLPISVEQVQEFLSLEQTQKELEDLHADYKAITDAINEALKQFGEKI